MLDLMTFMLLHLLGVMSPGPDFAIITRYGLEGSRRSALLASLGIAAALLIHVTYCVSGVALFLSSSPQILCILKILGALYLGYLGVKIFLESRTQEQSVSHSMLRNAFMTGFFTNLLNPKATVFLLSLFSLFANSMNSLSMKIAFALSIPLIAVTWFSTLSYFLTHSQFLPFLQTHRRKFMMVMGVALLCLSISGIVSAVLEF